MLTMASRSFFHNLRRFFLLGLPLLAVGPSFLVGGWFLIHFRFGKRECPNQGCFLVVVVLDGYLVSFDAGWGLFRCGGSGLFCSCCCLFLLLGAVGWLSQVWVCPPWFGVVSAVSYKFLHRSVLGRLLVTSKFRFLFVYLGNYLSSLLGDKDIGNNLGGDDNETEGGDITQNLAAGGQPLSNKDPVFVNVVVVSGEGCEGGGINDGGGNSQTLRLSTTGERGGGEGGS